MHSSDPATLLLAAEQASKQAYAPYSGFRVGAAALLADGATVTGTNVENASYGLTQCAERNLLNTLVAQGHQAPLPVIVLAVWGARCNTASSEQTAATHGAVTPCGACRQVMVELLPPETPIIYKHPATGAITTSSPQALLPDSFSLSAPTETR